MRHGPKVVVQSMLAYLKQRISLSLYVALGSHWNLLRMHLLLLLLVLPLMFQGRSWIKLGKLFCEPAFCCIGSTFRGSISRLKP